MASVTKQGPPPSWARLGVNALLPRYLAIPVWMELPDPGGRWSSLFIPVLTGSEERSLGPRDVQPKPVPTTRTQFTRHPGAGADETDRRRVRNTEDGTVTH